MKVVVVKSPKVISGLMRLIFKIKKEEEQDNWRYSCDPPPVKQTAQKTKIFYVVTKSSLCNLCRLLCWVPKNKPCKRNNRQISDNTKIAAKQGNAEERPDAGCEIKRWKAAAEMSSVFNIPPDISKADKPQGFGDRVPDSRQAANLSSKYIAN